MNLRKNNSKLFTIIFSALFAALICVATMVIRIPSPTNGYANLGDCFVILSGWIMGPIWGALAAGIGSMFADIFAGYAHYAPATFVIKALMALCAYYIFKALSKKETAGRLISSVCAELIMIFGYFIFSSLILGNGIAAAASMISDSFQGLVGIIMSNILIKIIHKYKLFKHKF